jgi:hypothetical protein
MEVIRQRKSMIDIYADKHSGTHQSASKDSCSHNHFPFVFFSPNLKVKVKKRSELEFKEELAVAFEFKSDLTRISHDLFPTF